MLSECLSSFSTGDKVDYDGRYGPQCVDLARAYIYKIGGEQFPPVIGAGDIAKIYRQGRLSGYCEVDKPLRGCLAVHERGTYGHVAIVEKVSDSSVSVIEQDGYKLTGVKREEYPIGHFSLYLLPARLLDLI